MAYYSVEEADVSQTHMIKSWRPRQAKVRTWSGAERRASFMCQSYLISLAGYSERLRWGWNRQGRKGSNMSHPASHVIVVWKD